MNINKYVADRILEFRKLKDFTQEDLAEILGCTRQNYLRIEKGEGNISVTQLFKIYTAFEVSPNNLLPPRARLKKEFNEIRKAAIKSAIQNINNTDDEEQGQTEM